MPQIKLTKEFFEKERRDAYSNWKPAFWRELLANSLDAGATSIEIGITPSLITFEDNGKGMSLETAENVYLCLGKSSKDGDPTSVGGFGRARVLTCFSMQRYSLASQNYCIEGSGGEYSITQNVSWRNGVSLFIEDEFLGMEQELVKVLHQSNLPTTTLTLNGDTLWPIWLSSPSDPGALRDSRGNLVGTVGKVAEGPASRTIVRVNGLAMFDMYNGLGNVCLVVDLEPSTARAYLTANRDGPSSRLSGLLDDAHKRYNQSAEDSLSRTTRKQFTKILQGQDGARGRRDAALAGFRVAESPIARPFIAGYLLGPAPERSATLVSGYTRSLSVNTRDPHVLAAAMSWDAEKAFQPVTHRAFLAAWTQACLLAVGELNLMERGVGVEWSIGLYFGHAIARLHTEESEGITFIEINPTHFIGPNAKAPWGSKAWCAQLWATALHEVTHFVEEEHDAGFASLLTELVARSDQQASIVAIRNALRNCI